MSKDKTETAKSKSDYGIDTIKVLKGLEGVRRRPAMYIGSTGKEGLHHMIYEVVDNAIDEALSGVCTRIEVTLHEDGSVNVKDNGRGIPVEKHPEVKKSGLEVVMTMLHAGGKFDKKAYMISGGLHGVGVSVVNALSEKMIATVMRDGNIYEQTYKIGNPQTDVKITGKTNETGTIVRFWPDKEIFGTIKYDFSTLITRFRELAFLNSGLTIILKEEATKKKEEFQFKGGIIAFIQYLNNGRKVLHKPIYFHKEEDNDAVEIAIQYTDSYNESIHGFVNTINTIEGGTHVIGFKTALTRVINDYSVKNNLLKGNGKLTGDDVREGLTAIINLKIKEPQFEGQTKTKLGNSEVKGFVNSITTTALSEFFEENPSIARKIVSKVLDALKAREAAKKAKDLVRRKSALSFGTLPGKLADCISNKLEESEIFIVEGDSAGGCFSGDTKIALVDGRNISLKEIVKEYKNGKENFCYTIMEDGGVGVSKIINPRITKKNEEVIKIIFDNNKEVICTPDHKFMLRDGSYKQAKDLTKEDSLMPFHRRISKIGGRITINGYEMVWDQNKTWVFTHLLADEYNLRNKVYSKDQGNHKHHIDFNKLNNNPNNVIRLLKEEHLILHTEHVAKTLHRKDSKEKAIASHRTPEYKEKISSWAKSPDVREMLSKRAKKQWKNNKYKEYMAKRFKKFFDSDKAYRNRNKNILDQEQRKYWTNKKNRDLASKRVKDFFEKNPEIKEYLSNLAKEQWKDEFLLIWRRQKTKEQWTPEFRKKRKETYNKTYYQKTITLMKKVLENKGSLTEFDNIRIQKRDNSIISKKTFCTRFFDGDSNKMLEAVENFNHKIKQIELLDEKADVYDLEVLNTHNFALASGVFVHNSAKQARDKKIQAILPLRGKILNVEKANPNKVFSSEEISVLISALGTGVGEHFSIDNLRYGKIIIMCDADVDGQHIKTLLLTFFFRFIPKLIEAGHIFVAVPPLYRIRKGKDSVYVYDDAELKKISGKGEIQRFKGLGEMNPDQLWETAMNPKKRILRKITIKDAAEADRIFSILMGSEVEPRKKFIEENAKYADVDV
ncbi:MAG: DNA topoisomerase (ATP-hydrolyzing) subunit B [Nanoarchaeota archaeon]|nr:DNA topoisomerase (ATP-hydrolyzing) subunit B [Nanoarchaeota archaeon]